MTRIVLNILRTSLKPMTTRDIALQKLVERAPNKDDQRLSLTDCFEPGRIILKIIFGEAVIPSEMHFVIAVPIECAGRLIETGCF